MKNFLYRFLIALTLCSGITIAINSLHAMQPSLDTTRFNAMAIDWWNAVEFGNISDMQNLVNRGFSPDVQDRFGQTALLVAVCRNNYPMVEQLLINMHADSDVQDEYGQTALMVAAYGNCIEIVSLLLQAHANWMLCDSYGRTALEYATIKNKRSIALVSMLLDKYFTPYRPSTSGQ